MKKLNLGLWLAAALAALLPGCVKYEPVRPPNIRVNPYPKTEHRAVLHVNDQLEAGLIVTAEVIYGMENQSPCVPLDQGRSLGGSRPMFGKTITVPINRIDDYTYEVKYYNDYLMDEDYYGLGKCHWTGHPILNVNHAGVDYIVTNNTKKTRGQSEEKICVPGTSTQGACAAPEYARAKDAEGAFHITLTSYKD